MIDLTQDEVFNQRLKPDGDILKNQKPQRRISWMPDEDILKYKELERPLKTNRRKHTMTYRTYDSKYWKYWIDSDVSMNAYTRSDTMSSISFSINYTNRTTTSTTFNYRPQTDSTIYYPITSDIVQQCIDIWACDVGETFELEYDRIDSQHLKSSEFTPCDKFAEVPRFPNSTDLDESRDVSLTPKNGQYGFKNNYIYSFYDDERIPWEPEDVLDQKCDGIHKLAGFRPDRFRNFLSDNWHRITLPFFKKKWFQPEREADIPRLPNSINMNISDISVTISNFI